MKKYIVSLFLFATLMLANFCVFGQEEMPEKHIVQNADSTFSIVTVADKQPVNFGEWKGAGFTLEELSTMLGGKSVEKKEEMSGRTVFSLKSFPFFWREGIVTSSTFKLDVSEGQVVMEAMQVEPHRTSLYPVFFISAILFALGVLLLLFAYEVWRSRLSLFSTGAILIVITWVLALTTLTGWGLFFLFVVVAAFSVGLSCFNDKFCYSEEWKSQVSGFIRAAAVAFPIVCLNSEDHNGKQDLAICLSVLIAVVWGIMLATSWKRLKAEERYANS